MYDSTGVSYPLADSRGTPMAWALANGQVAVQGYGAFGEEGGSNIGRFGFTGQMRLPEIGLDSYKARFYDPLIGRFMTPDPAGMVDGPNLYSYVLNDPINLTDPSGLYRDDCVVVTGSRIPRCGSQFTPSIQDGGNTGVGGGGGGGGGGGFGGGGGCMETLTFGPDGNPVFTGCRIPRQPFSFGPAFPIFGGGGGGPVVGGGPSIGDGGGDALPEMMMEDTAVRQGACEAGFGFAGGVAGALVGGVIVGSALAAAPAGAAVAVSVAAIAVGGTIAGLAVDAFFGPAAGGSAAIVGGLSVPFAAAGFRAAFPGAAGRVAVFGIRGVTPVSVVTTGTALVGALAGGALGGALCSRRE